MVSKVGDHERATDLSPNQVVAEVDIEVDLRCLCLASVLVAIHSLKLWTLFKVVFSSRHRRVSTRHMARNGIGGLWYQRKVLFF